jgi:hypothetical protein
VREIPKQPFQLSFNTSLKVDFQGSRVTSGGGLILVRELDERLGFGALIEQHLTDSRRGKNTQFPFADLLRQSVYSRLAGYENWPFRGLWKHLALQARLTIAFSGGQVYFIGRAESP